MTAWYKKLLGNQPKIRGLLNLFELLKVSFVSVVVLKMLGVCLQ